MDRGAPEVEGLEAQSASSGNRDARLQAGDAPSLEISRTGLHGGSERDIGGVLGALDGHKCALMVILDGAIVWVLTGGDTKGAADSHEQRVARDGAALAGEPGAARAGAELFDVLGSGEVEVFANHVPDTARIRAEFLDCRSVESLDKIGAEARELLEHDARGEDVLDVEFLGIVFRALAFKVGDGGVMHGAGAGQMVFQDIGSKVAEVL